MQRGRQLGRITRDTIAIAAGSALLVLVGCMTVTERLTGVEPSRLRPTTCMQRCSSLYRSLFDEERKRHVANTEVCWTMTQAARGACLEEEGLRHAAEMERLSLGLTECQTSCERGGG